MTPLQPPEDLADDLMATHAAYFHEHPDGELLTSCLILTEDGKGLVIACPWGDADERAVHLPTLRRMMVTTNAIRYAVWSEAWSADGEAAQAFQRQREAADEFVSMANLPGRQECVVTLVVDAARKQPLFRQQAIVRDAKGLVTGLELMPVIEHNSFGGELANLLPPRAYQ